jgi:hypothetical protein
LSDYLAGGVQIPIGIGSSINPASLPGLTCKLPKLLGQFGWNDCRLFFRRSLIAHDDNGVKMECKRCSKKIKKVFNENQKKLKNEKKRGGKRVRRYRVGTSVVEIPNYPLSTSHSLSPFFVPVRIMTVSTGTGLS